MKCNCFGCKNTVCKCVYDPYSRVWPVALTALILISIAYLLPPGIIAILFAIFGIGFLGSTVFRVARAACRWLFPFK